MEQTTPATNATSKPAIAATTNMPIFVYGTLRHGNRLWKRFIGEREASYRQATIKDHALFYSAISCTYPTMLPRKGSQVVGDVLYIKPEHYEDVLHTLYELEVLSSGYKEVVLDIDGEKALVYIATNHPYARPNLIAPILTGDWNTTPESSIGRATKE